MPLTVQCPSCEASLKVPDELVGKKIKCKKCNTPFVVEADMEPPQPPKRKKPASSEREDETPRSTKAKPPVREIDEDDDDSEESPRPKAKRGKKKKQAKKPPVLLFALLGVGLLLLVGGGITIYALSSKSDTKKSTESTNNPNSSTAANLPPKWQEYTDTDYGFRFAMPRGAGSEMRPLKEGSPVIKAKRWQAITGDGLHDFTIAVLELGGGRNIATDPETLKATLEQADSTALTFVRITKETPLDVGGKPGVELDLVSTGGFEDEPKRRSIYRLTAVGNKLYALAIQADRGPMDPAIAKTFFDSFKIQ